MFCIRMNLAKLWPAILLYFMMLANQIHAQNFELRCIDRTAVERIYYAHRLRTDQPFEQAVPRALIERLVRQDLLKQTALRAVYGVTVTDAQLQAETERINISTRAPEMLAEIKNALGNDSARFADAVVRPIVVERLLRNCFDNDDKLHAPQRQEAERVRQSALAAAGEGIEKQAAAFSADKAGTTSQITWQLTPPSAEEKSSEPADTPPRMVTKSNAYSIESEALVAPALETPGSKQDWKLSFDDLAPELRNVLQAQLQRPGNVSAVIETPSGFLVFLVKERTADALSAVSFSLPKRSYETWLAEQPDDPLP